MFAADRGGGENAVGIGLDFFHDNPIGDCFDEPFIALLGFIALAAGSSKQTGL